MTDRSVTKHQYVCDTVYHPLANAIADCQICGWEISRHKTSEPTLYQKGPFKPEAPVSSKKEVYKDSLRQMLQRNWGPSLDRGGIAIDSDGNVDINDRCYSHPQTVMDAINKYRSAWMEGYVAAEKLGSAVETSGEWVRLDHDTIKQNEPVLMRRTGSPQIPLWQMWRRNSTEETSECRRAGLSEHAAGTGGSDTPSEAPLSRGEITAQSAEKASGGPRIGDPHPPSCACWECNK